MSIPKKIYFPVSPHAPEFFLIDHCASFKKSETDLEYVLAPLSKELADAVDNFIDKTQEESKKVGHNRMLAPEEYVAMMKALVEFRKGLL